MKKIIVFIASLLSSVVLFGQAFLEVDASQQGKKISHELIGVFFEDINYAADGGLYAELIQNRSFEYYKVNNNVSLEPLTAWSLGKNGATNATMQIEDTNPLNANNTKYLKVIIKNAGNETVIKNTGFKGISVQANRKYKFSVYLRSESAFDQPIVVRIESGSGLVLGSGTIRSISTGWKKYSLEIPCSQTNASASLNIATKGTGILYFDMVSLFPENTFKNRENGLRQDLAQAIADIKPKFFRFPGGCISHGEGNENAYRWEETLGDIAQRKPNWNLWGYHQTYGLGFFEYFQFCEDIGAKPLPVLPLGISCQFRGREVVPMSEMGPWVQDAIDLIEFSNGDVSTHWGKVRADMGHPQPFKLEYLCLGNEEDDIPEFRERFILIADAVKKAYPEIKIIGTSGTAPSGGFFNSLWQFSREQNLYAVDEHYYMETPWFLSNLHRYDNIDRHGPKVFIGEYASKDDRLANAIAEAAYLTGVEKNADVIQFACYAPLLCNENNNQWHPDLIRFNNTQIVKTANYYVQQLFSMHAGDEYFNSSVSYDKNYFASTVNYSGKIGIGTWNSQADFDDIKVVSDNKVILQENFNSGTSDWKAVTGTFNASGGVCSQSSNLGPAWSIFKTPVRSSVYTYTLRARKTGGNEGFLIPFAFTDNKNFYWLNIGGWGNSQHAVEMSLNGSRSPLITKAGSIEKNKWYAIKIEVDRNSAKCYLDNKLLFDIPAPEGPVSASVTKDDETNEMIFKMVNSGSKAIQTSVKIKGLNINQNIKVISLSGLATQRNTITTPDQVSPGERMIHITNLFDLTLPANSFQLFRIKNNPKLK